MIIETCHLDYSYNSKEPILKDINLKVPFGSIYGFLGPNGAGKTTTLRLLLSLLKSQDAPIRLFGMKMQGNRLAILKRIGSLIESPSLYTHLNARENLKIYQLSYECSKKRIDEVLNIVGLSGAAEKKTKAYSLGMKQRLAIAIALLNDPDLLILDEPTNGLDPNGIIEIRDLFKALNKEHGKTIVISSHLLPEIEKIATHVGIINQGKLLFQGTLPELQELKSNGLHIGVETNDQLRAIDLLKTNYQPTQTGNQLQISYRNNEQIAAINEFLVTNGIKVYRIGMINSDLEDIFIQIIKASQ